MEFDGYYLESETCVACSCPEVPYTGMKLDNLKSETKFTDNKSIVKCTGSHTIQSVMMTVHDARRSKSVKELNLYYNNRPICTTTPWHTLGGIHVWTNGFDLATMHQSD